MPGICSREQSPALKCLSVFLCLFTLNCSLQGQELCVLPFFFPKYPSPEDMFFIDFSERWYVCMCVRERERETSM